MYVNRRVLFIKDLLTEFFSCDLFSVIEVYVGKKVSEVVFLVFGKSRVRCPRVDSPVPVVVTVLRSCKSEWD